MKYLRDGRAPVPESEAVSRVMSANRAKNTKPELVVRVALREAGLTGYRIHPTHVPGRPDIVFPKHKLAIFVNGCYWHRCPYCRLPLPRSHAEFWREKFEKNKARDKAKARTLRSQGWTVVTLWECQIEKNTTRAVEKIRQKMH